jgi:predicted Zn-dependent protease
MGRRDIVRGLWTGAVAIGVLGGAGCESAATFFAPSDADLMAMSAEAWEQTKREMPISADAAAKRRLEGVGSRIARAAGREGDAWEFVVFDNPEKNAFVLPGGKVGFYKGLLDFSRNDDELAAVLGHEVGHVTARHAALRAGQQQATALGLALGSAMLGMASDMSRDQREAIMAIAGAGAAVGILLPFSRQNEIDADRLGVDYMHSAGYDVRSAVELWRRMSSGGQERGFEWVSTHPSPETRVQDLTGYINARGYALL